MGGWKRNGWQTADKKPVKNSGRDNHLPKYLSYGKISTVVVSLESNEKRGAGAAFIWYLQPLLTYEKIKKYKFFTVYEKLVFT